MYIDLYKHVFKNVMDHYRPNIIVLQSGADSIAEDILGHFNLSSKAHGECVDFTLN
jgi:acetoin utilization deacetylase AcuC-like enzyme